jgi:hypothetical protein
MTANVVNEGLIYTLFLENVPKVLGLDIVILFNIGGVVLNLGVDPVGVSDVRRTRLDFAERGANCKASISVNSYGV